MLILRHQQMAALAEAATLGFRQRACEHLRQFVPADSDDAAIDQLVKTAIARAAGYGIDDELAVLRYLNAMHLLGVDFDTDPALPWASAVLRDPEFGGAAKMEIIKDLIAQHLAAA